MKGRRLLLIVSLFSLVVTAGISFGQAYVFGGKIYFRHQYGDLTLTSIIKV